MKKNITPGSKAYSKYIDAKLMPTPDGKISQNALLDMQRAIFEALRSGEDIDAEMRQDLAFAFEEMLSGNQPVLLTTQRGSGKPYPAITKYLVEEAMRYLRWVEDGLIKDENPIGTVAVAFCVSDRAVKNWIEQWKGRSIPPMVWESDDLSITEDDDGNLVRHDLGGIVERMMKVAGVHYAKLNLWSARFLQGRFVLI